MEYLNSMTRETKAKLIQKNYQLLNKQVKILIKFPEIGLKTTEDTTRGLIIGDFIIYYQLTEEKIIIHTVWDCRQNPDSKIIK